ncbi:MAG: hypothetical protein P8Q90_06205 [Candidatus Thalassarchaeaceae archaeon]|nr:hypothetical protein [Candidatus Thalassarchaeaceae archaeon]
MRKGQKWALALLFCLIIQYTPAGMSASTGISDVENGCTCHNAVPTSSVNITFEGIPLTYEVNTSYTLIISATGGAQSVENHTNFGGFNLWMSHGVLSNLSNEVQVFSINEVGHTGLGNDQRAWTVNWTAPADNSTRIHYRLHVNTVNGDGVPSNEDQWNRKIGSFGQGTETLEQTPVSPIFLYGVPICLISLIALIYRREMKKLNDD